jgi:hypothetical protein
MSNSKFVGALASLVEESHQENFKKCFIHFLACTEKKLSKFVKKQKANKKQDDDKHPLFFKQFRSMKLDRNEAIEVIKQSHKLVNIFVDQQKQLQQIEKTQNTKHTDLASEVEEFWKRFIDYMVIFSSSQVDLSKIGGLKRWNELIQKWGEDYR